LVSFVSMLGLSLWRALQPATIPTNTVGDNVMEMKSQDSNAKANSGRGGWGQLSSNNARPQTLCYATNEDMAVPAGGNILAVGNGPVFLLAAKTAAKAGYKTTIVEATENQFTQLLWSEAKEEARDPNLTVLGVSKDEDVKAFNDAIANADGVLIAFDTEQTLTDTLLDVVLPATGGAKRVAYLSRHLNGKGQGPLVAAAKGAANKEVWAAGDAQVKMYRDFETKLKNKIASRDVDAGLTIVRCGTLKGGGPGSADDRTPDSVACLSEKLYDDLARDIVNWQLLFDCDTRGVKLTKGDTAEGPGLRAVFTACASEASPGDSGRIPVCQALVRSLGRPDAAGKEFGVTTAASEAFSTDAEWTAELDGVLA